MKYELFEDNLLLKPLEAVEEVRESGLIVPVIIEENSLYRYATVVAAGPGRENEPMEVKVGDTVVFKKRFGVPVRLEFNKEDHIMLPAAVVEGIIK